jgi:DNA-binding NarL/FixJ family response regulator
MPRVLIAEKESLLGAAVQSFLVRQPGLEVIGISPADQAQLVQEVDRLRPDVVILGEPSQLIGPAQLLTFLRDYPTLRVVVVNVDHSLVRIYDKHQVSLKRADQILDILHNNQGSSNQ